MLREISPPILAKKLSTFCHFVPSQTTPSSSPINTKYYKMSTDICGVCEEPLLLTIDPDSEDESIPGKTPDQHESVPDDVELSCGCHFHWECFLDAYTITECPNCGKNISSLSSIGQQQVLCTVRNEGGTQTDFDILPTATEEAYLRAYPEERKAHAFLEFCREGDVDAILHMIKNDEESDAEGEEQVDLLRYCGTFEGIEGSGLHVAIRYNRIEVAWLMLVLGSSLEWSAFPPEVLKSMKGVLSKEDRKAVPDIRTLQDADGRTPAALAQEVGGLWTEWLQNQRLQAP